MLLGRLMPLSFSDDQRRRHTARHESRRVAPVATKRKKRRRRWLTVSFPVVSVFCCLLLFGVGGDLLSHNLPVAVPSACAGLASGFGMGPGVSLQLLTTDKHAKHKPLLVGCPPRGGCCVRYCIVDAVTTVTIFLLFFLVFLLSYTSVLVFVVVN